MGTGQIYTQPLIITEVELRPLYPSTYGDLGSVLPAAPKEPKWLRSEGWMTSAARARRRRRETRS